MKRIILVDGNSLMYRAYFATAYSGSLLQNSKGVYTNAIYAFIKMISAITNSNYDNILVAFDAGKHTFRHDLVETYKGGRSPMPEELKSQIPHIVDFLSLIILCFSSPHYPTKLRLPAPFARSKRQIRLSEFLFLSRFSAN